MVHSTGIDELKTFNEGDIVIVNNKFIYAFARIVSGLNVYYDVSSHKIVFFRTPGFYIEPDEQFDCSITFLTLSNQEELDQWILQRELMS